MSEKAIGIGLVGLGTVGGGVAELLRTHAETYRTRTGGCTFDIRGVLVRNVDKHRQANPELAGLITNDVEAFFATDGVDIIVEVAGGIDPVGGYVERALKAGKHVVTANKSLLAARGPELFALARESGASIAFEASCAGGIPCITALQFGLMANEQAGMYGILNGTCNYILTEMTQKGRTYEDVLAEAQEKGYAEADPTLDVSGADAAQKLAILASLAYGAKVDESQIITEGIDSLQLEDIAFGSELGYDIKLLATAERWAGEKWVCLNCRPCFIAKDALLAKVVGPFNALSVFGDAVGHTMFYGAGAGRMPTASAVVSDLLNVASGWYPAAFSQMQLTPDCYEAAPVVERDDVESRWYLRLHALDRPGTMAQVTRILGDRNISLSSMLQHEDKAGSFVPVVIMTHAAREGDVRAAAKQIEQLDEIEGAPVTIRVLDVPTE